MFLVRSTRQAVRYPAGVRLMSSKNGDDWWGGKPGGSVFDELPTDDTPATPSVASKDIPVRKSSLFTAAPVRRQPVVAGTPKLSLDEALFLAKEAGVFTTRETQTHIIKSPSFSSNDSPFLLENFFDAGDVDAADLGFAGKAVAAASSTTAATEQEAQDVVSKDVVPESVHEILSSLAANPVQTFGARGREWRVTAQGKGTRKRSTAHVVIERGTGIVKVNGEEDFYKRFPLLANRFDVLFPFQACGAAGLFDVYICVKGGGISGQAGAARLAVGRALVSACNACEDDLKESLVLHEDTRQKTSKFPGKKGAYARHNWTLRWCFVVSCDIVIPPIVSKYTGKRLCDAMSVKRGERLFDVVRRNVKDVYEQRAVYNHCLFEHISPILDERAIVAERKRPRLLTGIEDEFFEFENALSFLTQHTPTRMKTLEQLEGNYHKSIQQVKHSQRAAVSALQTRQALEMDMITSTGECEKLELETMVTQHVSEMDAVVAHWHKELTDLHQRQLTEYKALVMEVFLSESKTSHPVTALGWQREYRRPEIVGLTWQSMWPVSVSTNEAFKTRLVRCTSMQGDFLDSLITPLLVEPESFLDPEELIACKVDKVRSAVVLGFDTRLCLNSNQDSLISRVIDGDAPSDCRWPSLAHQLEKVKMQGPDSLFVTRHSNLANGVVAIFHCANDTCLPSILQWCDCMHVERLFVPHAIVPDLLAPGASEAGSDLVSIVTAGVRQLSNVVSDQALREIVFVHSVPSNV